VFKSEIRNSRAQPRRARAAAQSGRACGAIARGQSPQRAVGVRLAERASAACSSRSASNDACSALHAACMRIAGARARAGPPARLQRQLVLPKRDSGTTLQRRRRQRQCERLTLSAAAVHSVLHAAPCSPSSPAAASAHRQLLQQSQQQPFFNSAAVGAARSTELSSSSRGLELQKGFRRQTLRSKESRVRRQWRVL
jgi:hypothetical protein